MKEISKADARKMMNIGEMPIEEIVDGLNNYYKSINENRWLCVERIKKHRGKECMCRVAYFRIHKPHSIGSI